MMGNNYHSTLHYIKHPSGGSGDGDGAVHVCFQQEQTMTFDIVHFSLMIISYFNDDSKT